MSRNKGWRDLADWRWKAGLTSAFQSRAVVQLYFLLVTYMLERHGR